MGVKQELFFLDLSSTLIHPFQEREWRHPDRGRELGPFLLPKIHLGVAPLWFNACLRYDRGFQKERKRRHALTPKAIDSSYLVSFIENNKPWLSFL
jgi:hypothetical protein